MAQNNNSKQPPSSNTNGNGKLHAIIHSQKQTLHLFLSNPATRTPTIVLYVASFGGALHAAVTTYFYLAIGASEMDIGQLGFIMSVGALVGSPISGIALDRYGPWVPISVTAGACAWGCLWRGIASSLSSLRMGAILLGIGINMWTVVLGHLVKSSPPSMRSEVMSGFGVQMTVLQLIGKGVFPFAEYGLHHVVGLEDSLLRYRIHMGMCTFFCFYGTFALFWDKKNVVQGDSENSNRGKTDDIIAKVKYQQKHSDVLDEYLEDGSSIFYAATSQQPKEIELAAVSNNVDAIQPSTMSERDSGESSAEDKSYNTSSSSFLNEPESLDQEAKQKIIVTADDSTNNTRTSKQLVTTITLTFALLIQSIATTILTILWPLLAHDKFDLSAHTFGVLTFLSSVVSTGAVAAFPTVERFERIGGRVRCAAWGFGLGAMLCLLFCFCSFGDYWTVVGVEMDLIVTKDGDTSISNGIEANGSRLLEQDDAVQYLHSRKQFLLHALSAMAFQAALCFLEPSLKSILSLVVNSSSTSPSSKGSSLGGTVGFMQTLGSVGGMIGNLAGTYMYKMSKDIPVNINDGFSVRQGIFRGGSLPFAVTAVFMALASILIWRLEEPTNISPAKSEYSEERQYTTLCQGDVESGHSAENAANETNLESLEDPDNERSDSCCLALRETTYDLKLD